MIRQTPRGFERVHPDEPDLVGEAAFAIAEEMAVSSDDVYLRRRRIGMWRPDVFRRADVSRAHY
jgi:glycerol-3-phosphate dehydrogenase